MKVSLENIIRENFHDVIELEVEPSQEDNLPSNVYSIAESTLSPLFHPRAICVEGAVKGFAMYQFGLPGTDNEDKCTIWRFMVDRRFQNTGIGKRAMRRLLDEIKAHQCCSQVEIYYDPEYAVAKKLYARFGFRVVGVRDDGDVIAERPI